MTLAWPGIIQPGATRRCMIAWVLGLLGLTSYVPVVPGTKQDYDTRYEEYTKLHGVEQNRAQRSLYKK